MNQTANIETQINLITLLNEQLRKEQLREEKEQLKEKNKSSVPFSRATLNDCVRADGLALNIDYVIIDAPTIHIPVDFQGPIISDFLSETLARIEKVWVLDNEKACRIVIDAILTEVLLNESNEQLLGFCEVNNYWEGTGLPIIIDFTES